MIKRKKKDSKIIKKYKETIIKHFKQIISSLDYFIKNWPNNYIKRKSYKEFLDLIKEKPYQIIDKIEKYHITELEQLESVGLNIQNDIFHELDRIFHKEYMIRDKKELEINENEKKEILSDLREKINTIIDINKRIYKIEIKNSKINSGYKSELLKYFNYSVVLLNGFIKYIKTNNSIKRELYTTFLHSIKNNNKIIKRLEKYGIVNVLDNIFCGRDKYPTLKTINYKELETDTDSTGNKLSSKLEEYLIHYKRVKSFEEDIYSKGRIFDIKSKIIRNIIRKEYEDYIINKSNSLRNNDKFKNIYIKGDKIKIDENGYETKIRKSPYNKYFYEISDTSDGPEKKYKIDIYIFEENKKIDVEYLKKKILDNLYEFDLISCLFLT